MVFVTNDGQEVYEPLSSKDDILLFDNTAFIRPPGSDTWVAEVVAAVFRPLGGLELDEKLSEICRFLGIAKENREAEVLQARLKLFVQVPQDNKIIRLGNRDTGDEALTVGPTGDNGILSPVVRVPGPGHDHGNIVVFEAVLPRGDARHISMQTVFSRESGYGIISDIDDTIKVSEVNDRFQLLRNTFLEDSVAVPSMPQLYRSLQSRLQNPTFFYLSASPWQLYPSLREFTAKNYPFGQIILRDMTYMQMEAFFASLTLGTEGYKVDRMEKIHTWLPHRKFLCIGDSTQRDPEAYATMYHKHPDWIIGIWIRIVEGVDIKEERKLNDPSRFEKAFKNVPRNIWRTFKDPAEVFDVKFKSL